MNGFKNINDVDSGVKRPFRLSDLQAIWDAMPALVAGVDNPTTRIVSGFADEGDHWGSGLIMYNGVLYLYEKDPEDAADWVVKNGAIWGVKVESDDRVFETGLTKPFYIDHKATSNASGVPAANRVYIGLASEANIDMWKTNFISAGAVTEEKIADGAVTMNKIADAAIVRAEQIGTCVIQKKNLAVNAYPCLVSYESFTIAKTIASGVSTISIPFMQGGSVGNPQIVDPSLYACPSPEWRTASIEITMENAFVDMYSSLIIDTTIPESAQEAAPNQLSIFVSVFASQNTQNNSGGLQVTVGNTSVGFSRVTVLEKGASEGFMLLNLVKVVRNNTQCYVLTNTPITR